MNHLEKIKVLYLSHGGGPLPLLGDKNHKELIASLTKLVARIQKPEAIIVFSAHWEEAVVTITSQEQPPLIYDYFGFPEAAYRIQYPSPGHPQLAEKIHSLLTEHNIACNLSKERGYDHGVYVPLKIMYPDADIPVIQVSLLRSLDPAAHINIGKALSTALPKNSLVIGSGFSFHNMRAFIRTGVVQKDEKNIEFENWLIETCTSKRLSKGLGEAEREQGLIEWANAPSARYCHPREEHLLPLHVCYGLAQQACKGHEELTILGKKASMYYW